MSRAASSLSLAFLALIASCTTAPPGVVSVEARGGIYSSDVAEAVGLFLDALASGASSSSSNGSGRGNGGQTADPEWTHDVNASYGLQGAINTSVIDIVGGVDQHWFDDRGAQEWNIGVRKRFDNGSDPGNAYLQVVARHGSDLRTDSGLRDYDGIGFGGGFIAPLDEHWFVDISLVFESTWNSVRIDGEDEYLFSLMLNVGLGFSP